MALSMALLWPAPSTSADTSEIVVTGEFATNDVGMFGVSLSIKTASGCGGALEFGAFAVDAIGTMNGATAVAVEFCVDYVDTAVHRDAFAVQIKIDDFILSEIPSFEGSAEANFQIPNRYLTLTSVGDITGGSSGPGIGALSADQSDESLGFSGATAGRRIAQAAPGSGVDSAKQEIELTLSIPAGVYPGTYTSTILVETVTAP